MPFPRFSAVIAVFAFPLGMAWAAPANDNFASKTVLPASNSFTYAGTNADATSEPGDPANNGDLTVWYSWTAPRSGRVSLSMVSDLNNPQLTVLVGDNPLSGTYIAGSIRYDNFAGPATEWTTRFFANVGRTYHFCVYSSDLRLGGSFTLGLNCDRSVVANAKFVYPNINDDFDNPYLAGNYDATFVFHTLPATFEPFELDMLSRVRNRFRFVNVGVLSDRQGGVWINWTAPATGTAYFSAQTIAYRQPLIVMGRGSSIAGLALGAAGNGALHFPCYRGAKYKLYVISQYRGYPSYVKNTEVLARIRVVARR